MTHTEEIQALRTMLQEVRDSQIRLEESIAAMRPHCEKRFGDIETTLYGNGTAGLKSDVTRLKVWASVGIGACGLVGGLAGVLLGVLLERFLG